MSMNKIKINDTIHYRPSFGSGPRTEVTVVGLTVTDYPREKYGKDVTEVDIELVKQNKVVFSLSNGRWAYSEQIILPLTLEKSH